ncbi:hypothetical protein PGT21_019801 [Puccinia graminis f. sp. tritici]|uniref:Uncharacterized protein n=1 Tax=Puccinia graminis f. sp. tritici TaxID=56615 RepID=A0A5B0MTC5_PUCGR|nr:hypothetical protein PGT21_019801 [Puccinia graminis f. sp. tritici]
MTTSNAAGRESTPPKQASTVTHQSTRIRTPLERPGFIQTHTDSRRALQVPPSLPLVNQTSSQASSGAPSNQSTARPQGTNFRVDVDLAQDLDEENLKWVKKNKSEKEGYNNAKMYYDEPYKAPDQTSVRVNKSTDSNLKTHRDGSIHGNRLRKLCTGRAKSIAKGANLPQSAEEKHSAKFKTTTSSGTLTVYVQKGQFDVKTMNKILVFWII